MTDGPVSGAGSGSASGTGEDPASLPPVADLRRTTRVEPERRGNVHLLPSATVPASSSEPDRRLPGASGEFGSPDLPIADGHGLAGEAVAAEFAGVAETDPAADDTAVEREDWAWVREWRAGREPTPWSTGVVMAAFSALVTGVAVWVLSAGLADRPIVAALVNLLVAAGLAPAIWLSRGLPVLRWIAAGAAAGIVIGWISALLMLPLPSP